MNRRLILFIVLVAIIILGVGAVSSNGYRQGQAEASNASAEAILDNLICQGLIVPQNTDLESFYPQTVNISYGNAWVGSQQEYTSGTVIAGYYLKMVIPNGQEGKEIAYDYKPEVLTVFIVFSDDTETVGINFSKRWPVIYPSLFPSNIDMESVLGRYTVERRGYGCDDFDIRVIVVRGREVTFDQTFTTSPTRLEEPSG